MIANSISLEFILLLVILGLLGTLLLPNLTTINKTFRKVDLLKIKDLILVAKTKSLYESRRYTVEFKEDCYSLDSNYKSGINQEFKTSYTSDLNWYNGPCNSISFTNKGKVSNSNTIKFKDREGNIYSFPIQPVFGMINIDISKVKPYE